MNRHEMKVAIETRFRDGWAYDNNLLHTAVAWNKRAGQLPTDKPSVRIHILQGDSFNWSMGDPGRNVVRHVGTVQLQLRAPAGDPEDDPDGVLTALEDRLQPVFQNWSYGNGQLRLRTMQHGVDTEEDEMSLLMRPVWFPFHRDEYNG